MSNVKNNIDLKKVGIVVIGRNEGERLEKCLQSIVNTKATIIYVDSASSDNSITIANKYNIECIELSEDRKLSAALARNVGINHLIASSELDYIQLIDADCELNEHWLENSVNHLQDNPNTAAVCGRLREKHVNASIYNKLADLSWYIPSGFINSCGGIALVRARIFREGLFFNAELIAGEEPEFYKRVKKLGLEIQCIDFDMATHDSAMHHFSQWWTRNTKSGYGYASAREWGGFIGQEKSIFVWATIIPLLILICSLITPISLWLLLVYPLQAIRVALKLKKPYRFKDKLLESIFILLAKFPQQIGVLRFKFNKVNNLQYK